MALHDMLRGPAILVALGVEADIGSWAEFGDLVENDPPRTLAGRRPRGEEEGRQTLTSWKTLPFF